MVGFLVPARESYVSAYSWWLQLVSPLTGSLGSSSYSSYFPDFLPKRVFFHLLNQLSEPPSLDLLSLAGPGDYKAECDT